MPGNRRPNLTLSWSTVPSVPQGIFRTPTSGDGMSPVAASCGTALRDILSRVMRSNTEATKPWQNRLNSALRTMGAETVADSALRHIERQAAR